MIVARAAACALACALAGAEGEPDAKRLRAWHDLLSSEPHVAGTDGDSREIVRIATAFRGMGLETDLHEFWALLAHPVSARVEIVGGAATAATPVSGEGSPASSAPAGSAPPGSVPSRGRMVLPIIERNLAEDPQTAHPDLTWGWNAYSGSGSATGRVVYANYGTRADFDRLREWGVDCAGAVVIARYGGNFRGYKARFAQEAGAAALIMYIDPADSGSGKGGVWPESGGWANETCIQRGSILTLPWPGDPLTPGVPATRDAVRLDVDAVDLPKIPVQPIGYGAAGRIMSQMTGREVPEKSWQGGLAMPYRLEGGPDLKVMVSVEQVREVRKSANVIARLPGSDPEAGVIVVGCHHDAWGLGAVDPISGLICVLEVAQLMSERAKAGERLPCDVLFCAWGAEEYGMIGSTEWVEAHQDMLLKRCLGYINLDMAAVGPNLSASASPSIADAIAKATGLAPAAVKPTGGGSDHVAFVCRVGVPVVGIAATGAPGTSYHTNYDTTTWYRSIVGSDYASASTVTRAAMAALLALAESGGVPAVSATRVVDAALESLRALAGQPDATMRDAIDPLVARFESLRACATAWDARPAPAPEGERRTRREQRITLDRVWLDEVGLPGRVWYRNQFIAPDRDAGYSSTQVPGLADAKDAAEIAVGVVALERVADRLSALLCPITQ
ncbi:MAG: M28 family peptidase [Phycisphaerales bacterium]|nr:M28 family peptidase [Phycisphaerales bacterium]